MRKRIENRHELFRIGLIDIRQKNGLKQIELSRHSKVGRAVVSHIETGRRNASESAQWELARLFNATPEQLIERGRRISKGLPPDDPPGEPPRAFHITVEGQQDMALLENTKANYRGVPLQESMQLSSGVDGLYFSGDAPPKSEIILSRTELKHRWDHRLAAFRVDGGHMEPGIPEGAVVVVDLDDREFVNRKVFCVNIPENGRWTGGIRRVQEWRLGILLLSDNPERTPPIPAELDWQNLCVGRVVLMLRDVEEL